MEVAHDLIVLSIELAAASAAWLLVVWLGRRLFVAQTPFILDNPADPPPPDSEPGWIRNPDPSELIGGDRYGPERPRA